MMSRLMTRREQLVLGFLAVAVIVGSITAYSLRNGSAEPAPLVIQPADDVNVVPDPPAPLPVAPVAEVVVSIQGAVVLPGVYRVDSISRVNDLIQMAGGLAPGADTSDINLAARLVDGTTLIVPTRRRSGDETSGDATHAAVPDVYSVSTPTAAAASLRGVGGGRLISLNHATQQELETLPGIGPKLAEEIIQYRSTQPFRSIEDLLNVSGIGDAKLASVRDLVTVH